MSVLLRKGSAVWEGDLRQGKGRLSSGSKTLQNQAYSFRTRFEDEPGTNPEELIAAAHAACFSMAFANTLAKDGYKPQEIATEATCSLSPKEGGGFEITKMELDVQGKVEDLDAQTFADIAKKADQGCPVSNLLREGLQIVVHARLV
jgi:osmotically inducible protein OsmC